MQDTLRFTKMHGLGNDFVVIYNPNHTFKPSRELVRQFANRHTGIGFDQLLIISPDKTADFFCQIFNSDGSEAEQCGNGLRCVARFVHETKLHEESQVSIATAAGVFSIAMKDYQHITVTLGSPELVDRDYAIEINGNQYSLTLLNLGNPHAILRVTDINDPSLPSLGEAISKHKDFPKGINVGFLQIVSDHRAKLRTIERGAGETLACGSNAAAAGAAGIIQGWFKTDKVEIEVNLGTLVITYQNQTLTQTGPAEFCWHGFILI